MGLLKQSSTAQPLIFLLVLTSDHVTGATGLTPTVKLSKSGGSGASPAGTVSEIDATNHPGLYKVAGNATDTNTLGPLWLHASGTGTDPVDVEFTVVAFDPQDSVRAGLTALPNAAASAVGGLPVAVDTSGRVDVLKINGTSQTARDIGASVLLSTGTGTGQLDFTSGVVKANLTQILGTALTETSGQIAAAFKQFFNIATPTGTANLIPRVTLTDTVTTYTGNTVQTGDAYARIGAAGAGLTALGDTRIANLDGTITSRMASYSQPSGFLAATFPTGTIANTTNITAGTITTATTATNLTNAPTTGDFTAAMKTSLNAATPAVTVSDKTGFSLSSTQAFSNTGTWTGNIVGTLSTVTTATNLTNAATAGDLTSAMQATISGIVASSVSGAIAAGVPTAAQNAAAVLTSTANLTTSGSIGYILAHQLEGTFTSSSSSVFTTGALANAPTGGGTAPTVEDIDAQLSSTHGAGAWGSGSSGAGAFTILITVTDGTNPLQNATVRMIEGANPYTAITNSSGVAAFSLDSATYSVAITKAGYQFTPTTLVVSGATSHTYAMTQTVITPPSDPSLCRISGYSSKADLTFPDQPLFLTLTPLVSDSATQVIYTTEPLTAEFTAGHMQIDVVKVGTSNLIGYKIKCKPLQIDAVIAPTGSTFDIASLLP